MSELFKEALKQVSRAKTSISVGVVKELNGNTCTVERENLPPLLDVRLQALEGDFKNRFLIKPKVNSEVVCLSVDNEVAETCIVQYTEIDSVEINIGGAKIEVSNGKVQVKNEQADLKEILTDALQTLENAKILTPSGPGKFSPNEKLKFKQLKSKTEKLFN